MPSRSELERQNSELKALVRQLEMDVERARLKKYCGCSLCCASTPPEKRGQMHKEVCRAP